MRFDCDGAAEHIHPFLSSAHLLIFYFLIFAFAYFPCRLRGMGNGG